VAGIRRADFDLRGAEAARGAGVPAVTLRAAQALDAHVRLGLAEPGPGAIAVVVAGAALGLVAGAVASTGVQYDALGAGVALGVLLTGVTVLDPALAHVGVANQLQNRVALRVLGARGARAGHTLVVDAALASA
jgi:hypothetical protein